MRAEAHLTHQAQERPGKTAILDHDGTVWTYAALHAASTDVAKVLSAEGVLPGDRVFVLAENSAATAIAIFGAFMASAWAVPLNARQTSAELDRTWQHARPAALLFTNDVSPEAEAHAKRHAATPIGHGLSLAPGFPSSPASDADVAVLLYTTGTTGTPKGVMLTHGNLNFGGAASAWLRDMGPEDVVYGALPLSHVFGLASMLIAATQTGATIQMEPRFSAEKLYRALQGGVTLLPAVPQMHAVLMHYAAERGLETLNSATLRYVSSGAAPLDPAWKRKAEAFYGIALQNGYGMTEASAGVCATRNPIGVPDVSVGPPLPGVEIRIDAPADDGVGEVLMRGGNVMAGYFENPDETAKVLSADGWLRSGDLGVIDDSGFLHIRGRSKELIIRGGFNVYPPEVEAALNDHPNVVQTAVVGRRTETGDEEVIAFVQLGAVTDVSASELAEFIHDRLTAYKRPSRILTTLALPAASTGKLLKHKMLEHFADQL